jgi:hypothetical protein
MEREEVWILTVESATLLMCASVRKQVFSSRRPIFRGTRYVLAARCASRGPGNITWSADRVEVTLQPFNDRRLTRDLAAVCERVNAACPHLPDGRQVHLHLHGQANLSAKASL